MRTPNRVPLTIGQKARLIVDCYPFVLLALMSVALLIVFMGRAHAVPAANRYVVLFFSGDVVALLLSGYKAVLRVRDLVSGVARRERTSSRTSWRSGYRGAGDRTTPARLEGCTSRPAPRFKRGAGDGIASLTARPASWCGLWNPWTDTCDRSHANEAGQGRVEGDLREEDQSHRSAGNRGCVNGSAHTPRSAAETGAVGRVLLDPP